MMAKERRQMRQAILSLLALAGMASAALPAAAQPVSVGLRDSVPIGSNGLCEAQIQSPRPGDGLFDRDYLIVCRDAASAVGSLHVMDSASMEAALAEMAGDSARCSAQDLQNLPAGLVSAGAYTCTSPDSTIERTIVIGSDGSRSFAANGLTAYADALYLGLATLATDRLVDGSVAVPLTEAASAQSFARAQAEAISAELALDEAYRRSNAGNFADAAEFFSASVESLSGDEATEALLNSALQQSNLGNFREADALFEQAEQASQNNPLLARMERNFRAVDALNRGVPALAVLALDAPLPELTESMAASLQLQIDNALAERLSSEQGSALSNVGSELTLLERLELLDAQNTALRASALRQMGQVDEADVTLRAAYANIASVREGRVISMLWLRAQILAEMADIQETRGDIGGAESLHRQAITMLESNYPGSRALISARAQLAGLLTRSGRQAEALALFRDLVAQAEGKAPASLRKLMVPYFDLLAEEGGNSGAATDMFAASQLLVRPGLAQTQAVLARELSAGSDEAAQLFRRAININRSIEILRGELAQARTQAEAGEAGAADLSATKAKELEQMRTIQLELQQQLAQYPRYRAVSDERMTLADLQASLHSGEAYLKLMELGSQVYAIYAQQQDAQAYRIDASAYDVEEMVDILRDSIAIEEGGQTITYPFELGVARELYAALLGPVDGSLRSVDHLIFEPDGAMLRLPANLLVMDDASVASYTARTSDPEEDPYDYRGTAWLGRAMQVSTSVSPTAFRDVRSARLSDAMNAYLGLGQNLPLGEAAASGGSRSGQFAERCAWSPVTWGNPIPDAELRRASQVLQADGEAATILTGSEFTDTRLKQMEDLDEYRILHFATHGLVTTPEVDCPPRPALLTSFGDADSDGLLSFAEIFDLNIDADLVILSACNTASRGGLVAAREAGVSTGGDFALDGLVRAFVGAGGRTVVASHWPVPDDYDATGRLISGFFESGQGVGTAEALRRSQLALMEDADTSHPFYWAAFAVVGDGAVAVRR
jgi:CHAT domain-containing protein